MKFTIQFGGRDDQKVHKAGCVDLSRGARHFGETRETVEAPTLREAIAKVLGDPAEEGTLAEMGYDFNDFHILPCAR